MKSQPSVQSLLILAIIPMIFGFPYTTMMPLFASDLLKLGPEGFGLLLSISSIGALVGTTWLSLGKEIKGAGKWLIYSIMGFGLSLLLFIYTGAYGGSISHHDFLSHPHPEHFYIEREFIYGLHTEQDEQREDVL